MIKEKERVTQDAIKSTQAANSEETGPKILSTFFLRLKNIQLPAVRVAIEILSLVLGTIILINASNKSSAEILTYKWYWLTVVSLIAFRISVSVFDKGSSQWVKTSLLFFTIITASLTLVFSFDNYWQNANDLFSTNNHQTNNSQKIEPCKTYGPESEPFTFWGEKKGDTNPYWITVKRGTNIKFMSDNGSYLVKTKSGKIYSPSEIPFPFDESFKIMALSKVHVKIKFSNS